MDLKELASKAIKGELDLTFEHHPVHSFVDGSTEIQDNLLAFKGIAGFYVLDTGSGLVMLDAGHIIDIERAYEEIRKWRPNEPLVAAIFTHHHVDHIFAVEKFDEEALSDGNDRPTVYANKLMPEHFDRYLKTLGWNTAINRRQFAINVPHFTWPDKYRYPDVLVESKTSFTVGDTEFLLNPARGETDDHLWAFIPKEKILLPGDLFIWAVPNGGNPQKVQRYISDWADALDEMLKLDCEIFLPGHGFPILGKKRIKKALETTSKFLRSIEDQTLKLMNQGKSLNQVLHEVEIPNDLMELPWLTPIYDDPQFLIRMIWRRYGGWWDGEYDRLLPDTRENEAKEWVELSGGIDEIINKALDNLSNKKYKLAAHLIEVAFYADKKNEKLHNARKEIYAALSNEQESSMARNIFNHANLASSEMKRDLASED